MLPPSNPYCKFLAITFLFTFGVNVANAQSPKQQQLPDEFIRILEQQLKADAAERKRLVAQGTNLSLKDELGPARQEGWRWAKLLVRLLKADNEDFPGIAGLQVELTEHLQQIDPDRPMSEWPVIDVDALTRNNPKFWDAYYESAPGSGVLEATYAAMLQGNGEAARAQHVAIIGRLGKLASTSTRAVLKSIIYRSQRVMTAGYGQVQLGIKAFDNGDYEEAARLFQDTLKTWPQYGLAHFEQGLTRYYQEEIAAGRAPVKLGVVKKASEAVLPSAEVYALYGKAREHDPFQRNAYQGKGMSRKLMLVTRGIQPAWKHLSDLNRKSYDDGALKVFALASQKTELHDYALMMRQVQVSRRTPMRFQPDDHPFITQSLKSLAPGKQTDAALARLAGNELRLFQFRK